MFINYILDLPFKLFYFFCFCFTFFCQIDLYLKKSPKKNKNKNRSRQLNSNSFVFLLFMDRFFSSHFVLSTFSSLTNSKKCIERDT